jgi:hypothetical protein
MYLQPKHASMGQQRQHWCDLPGSTRLGADIREITANNKQLLPCQQPPPVLHGTLPLCV